MYFILFILWNIVFFGLMQSGFNYISEIHEKEQRKIDESKKQTEDKALKIVCKKYSKFINPDGTTVDLVAARRYMARMKIEQKKRIETINFEIVE